ncbi:hypothetical protein FQR65_LT00233 [Abscondita terminalis]|nr:hypothetical protein FQR65_LT00233 [Abscondita terminalis]
MLCGEDVEDDLRRLESLIRFVDEFLIYGDVEKRKSTIGYCNCNECWLKPKTILTPSDLVRKQKRLYRMKERLQRIIENRKAGKIKMKQEAAVRVIRNKIAEAMRAYWCHRKERELEKIKQRERVLDELKKLFGFNERFIDAFSPCVTKVLSYRKIRRFNLRGRKQRTLDIVRKILSDLVKPEKKMQRTIAPNTIEEEHVSEEESDCAKVEEIQPLAPFTPLIKEQALQTEPEPKPEADVQVFDFLLNVPVVNPRKKLNAGDLPDLSELLNEMSKGLRKERLCYEYSMKLLDGIEYECDRSFRTIPKTVTFQSFENGKIYTKRIQVCNGGPFTKKCLFKRFKFDENIGTQFEAERVGVQAVCPGMNFEISIRFSPNKMTGTVRGCAVFLTYSSRSRAFLQFEVVIVCLPLSARICVKQKSIVFDPTPIWEVKDSNFYRKLTIQNLSAISCLIAIVRVEEFEEVEAYLNEQFEYDEEEGGPYECISCSEDTYLQELLSTWTYNSGAFFFSRHCFAIPPYEKKSVKVFLRNLDYVGVYFEDYCLALFEDMGEKVKCVGTYYAFHSLERAMPKIFLLFAALFCALIQQGSCLRCYECTEVTNPNCAHATRKVPTPLCKQPDDVCVTHKTPAAVLPVDEYTSNLTTRVIRGCKFPNYCEYVKSFSAECVTCVKDFCNSAATSFHTKFVLAFVLMSNEVSVSAEVTGNFVEVEPLTLDFGVCVFNSVYNTSFRVSNRAPIPHLVGLKFPISLKKMLRSNAHDVMIQGRCTNTYCLKFVPRKDILQCGKYYDRGTRILEFPVYVCVLSKKFLTVPPCKMVVVAVITEDNGLSLSCGDFRFATYRHACCDEDVCNCESHAEYVVDLGDCTTAEAVYTDLIIANNSYVSQVFGFVNLPPCLQIMPNFGFGELMPLETKTLTLIYIPEVSDILNYDVECGDVNLRVEHRIKVETLKSLGGIDEDKPS